MRWTRRSAMSLKTAVAVPIEMGIDGQLVQYRNETRAIRDDEDGSQRTYIVSALHVPGHRDAQYDHGTRRSRIGEADVITNVVMISTISGVGEPNVITAPTIP